MSGYTSAPRPFGPAAAAIASNGRIDAARDWARALWTRLVLMRRTAETRRELGTLDPRLLADLGITRAEAAREAERWPWDIETSREAAGAPR
jgi:uncharacterized protein YjiS (DUF1127 family)